MQFYKKTQELIQTNAEKTKTILKTHLMISRHDTQYGMIPESIRDIPMQFYKNNNSRTNTNKHGKTKLIKQIS